jgi:hypothetical protein
MLQQRARPLRESYRRFPADDFQQESPKPSSRVQAFSKQRGHYGMCAPMDRPARARSVLSGMKPGHRDGHQNR